jgi:hypothetical protein
MNAKFPYSARSLVVLVQSEENNQEKLIEFDLDVE